MSRLTQRDRILGAFRAQVDRTLNTLELHTIFPEATRRVRELRAKGHKFLVKRTRDGIWDYTLVEGS